MSGFSAFKGMNRTNDYAFKRILGSEEGKDALHNLEEELEATAMENPAIRKALTIEEAFWRSERERRLFELREKALRDELVMLRRRQG